MNTFPSADGTLLNEMVWPAPSARATVALLHGYGEHIARYDHVAKAFVAAGITVYGCDLRGHGTSAGVRGHVDRFSEYLDDAAALIARARLAGGPLFVLGHSNGGLIATSYVLQHPEHITGLVLSSPFFGLKLAVPGVKVWAGRMASNIYPTLKIPSGLHGVDVSRDPAIQKDYDSDPLNNKNATARWFTETMAAQQAVFENAPSLRLPVLVLHGAADKIADPERTRAVASRFGSPDKTVTMLPGQYHEIFNEPEEDRVQTIAKVVDWIGARVA